MSSYLGAVQRAASCDVYDVPLQCIATFTDYVELLRNEAGFTLTVEIEGAKCRESWIGRVNRPYMPHGTGYLVHANSLVLLRSSCGCFLIAYKALADRTYECSMYENADPAAIQALLSDFTAKADPKEIMLTERRLSHW